MKYLEILLFNFLFVTCGVSQNGLDSMFTKTINKYFTVGKYYLKDTINPISLLNKSIKELVSNNILRSSKQFDANNKIKLRSEEKAFILAELNANHVWHTRFDSNCILMNSEKICTIMDSITTISTKLALKMQSSEISEKEYDELKKQLPYIIYVTKPIFLRKKKYILIGFTSIGGGLTGNPCHIIFFKKFGKEYREYIKISC